MVFVGVVDDVYVGALRQGTAVVGAVPSLVEAVGVEDLHTSAVEDCQAVVGQGLAGTAEARTEDGDACVVGGRGKGVGYPQDGIVLAGCGGFLHRLLRLGGYVREVLGDGVA